MPQLPLVGLSKVFATIIGGFRYRLI